MSKKDSKEKKKLSFRKSEEKKEEFQGTPVVYEAPIRVSCRKYLAAKNKRPHHMDAMVVFAEYHNYRGNFTVEEWDKLFEKY